MTAYNFTNGSITGQDTVKDTLPNTGGPYVRTNIVDFANQTLTSSTDDIANVLNVPADTWVTHVVARVITAESSNAEIHIGSGLDYDQWTNTILEVDSTGNCATLYAPEYFAAADTIDITNNNNNVDLDALKIEIAAVMIPGNKSDADGKSEAST